MPKKGKRFVKQLEITLPVNQQAAQGMVKIRTSTDFYMGERQGNFDHPAGVDLNAQTAQDTAKEDQIVEQGAPMCLIRLLWFEGIAAVWRF